MDDNRGFWERMGDAALRRIKAAGRWLKNSTREQRRVLAVGAVVVVILGLVTCSNVMAADAADNGVHASPYTEVQGFAVQYAPVNPPALVFYWFTYDEAGEQVWFISENVPVDATTSEVLVPLFKPMGEFLSGEGAVGDPVGVLAVRNVGSQLAVRFGIAPIDGFSEGCAADLPRPPLPSPVPPALPADEYPCQGSMVLERITPAIPELWGLP